MPHPQPALRRELNLRDLVLFNIAAVVGIRWLAAAAHSGPGSFSLWLLAAAFFFVPSALAVSVLSSKFPEEGGIYAWTKHSFGDWHGFLCGWCYWLSNLFYFPNLLLAAIGISAYTFGAARLAEDRVFVIPVAIAILWLAVITNLVGVGIGKWTQNAGGIATYAAGVLIVLIGAFAFFRHGSVTRFDPVPGWNLGTVNFWSQIAFAFGGLELGAVMAGEIRDPARTVRRATWISGLAIASFYILGTMAILVVLPPGEVSVVTGLAQAGTAAARLFGLTWLAPAMAGLLSLGFLGQLGAWLSASARVPFVIGVDRYLPPAFARLHPRWRTPHIAILCQGIACTVFLIGIQAGEDLRTAYQLLVDLTVVTYFIPFLYLYAAAFKNGNRKSGAVGLVTTAVAIGLTFIPPGGAASALMFEAKLIGGCALLILAGRLAFLKGRRVMRSAGVLP